MQAILSIVEEMERVLVDQGLRRGVLGFKAIFDKPTNLACPEPGEICICILQFLNMLLVRCY